MVLILVLVLENIAVWVPQFFPALPCTSIHCFFSNIQMPLFTILTLIVIFRIRDEIFLPIHRFQTIQEYAIRMM